MTVLGGAIVYVDWESVPCSAGYQVSLVMDTAGTPLQSHVPLHVGQAFSIDQTVPQAAVNSSDTGAGTLTHGSITTKDPRISPDRTHTGKPS